MIHKKVSDKLLTEGLFEQVVAHNYEALLFSGREKIRSVWSDDTRCKILIKDQVLRSFDLYLAESGDYPFYFEVYKITENDLFQGEV